MKYTTKKLKSIFEDHLNRAVKTITTEDQLKRMVRELNRQDLVQGGSAGINIQIKGGGFISLVWTIK